MINEITLKQKLRTCQLEPVGTIQIDTDNQIRFCVNKNDLKKGIYAWVECDQQGNPLSVLYVGKFGKTLSKRFREHTGGLEDPNLNVGRRNREGLEQALRCRQNKVLIYARQSQRCKVFGTEVSLNDAEEEAARKILKPTLNPIAGLAGTEGD